MNFSIIVPGQCNAKCDFCFWEEKEVCASYYTKLQETLRNLPEGMSLSITGGEPTLSKYFHGILTNIYTFKDKFTKVILTTNGANLKEILSNHHEIFSKTIDHVNISRHHFVDEPNQAIFKTTSVPNKEQLNRLCVVLNSYGIDVTLNAVVTEPMNDGDKMTSFIKFAKDVSASAVCFRKQAVPGGDLSPTKGEAEFALHKAINESSCPVCRTTTKLVGGIPVYFQASTYEPSNDLNDIYEVIMQPDGSLTTDWEGKNNVIINEDGEFEMAKVDEKTINTIDEVAKLLSQAANMLGIIATDLRGQNKPAEIKESKATVSMPKEKKKALPPSPNETYRGCGSSRIGSY